jgi:predicted acylesterase/phospholipase RssA
MATVYENVCLSAGGLKFPLHLGALHFLEESGMKPTSYAGTSCGAVVSALMAAGYAPAEIQAMRNKRPLSMFKLAHPVRWGLCKPAAKDEVRELLRARPAARPRRSKDPSFKDLREETGNRLLVTALRVRDGQLVTFGADPDTLDVPVHEAVTASCSIPFLNPPTEIAGELYVDGALGSYLPMSAFEDIKDKETVLGLMIADTKSDQTSPKTFKDFSGAIVDMVMKKLGGGGEDWERERTLDFKNTGKLDVGLFANPNTEKANGLFHAGYVAMKAFHASDGDHTAPSYR